VSASHVDDVCALDKVPAVAIFVYTYSICSGVGRSEFNFVLCFFINKTVFLVTMLV
jgi:hypothetical protein